MLGDVASYMFRSLMTIIRELHLYLTEVIPTYFGL